MPITISSEAIQEKNKLVSSGVWLLLLEIQYENEDTIYLCHNTETIQWNGIDCLACEFVLGHIE